MKLLTLVLSVVAGCASDSVSTDTGVDSSSEGRLDAWEASEKSVVKTYYVFNPTSNGCSSALKLTAEGTGITKIALSGCEVDATGRVPTFDSKTSGGTSKLSDTWYMRGTVSTATFDKDYTSANYQAWCDLHTQVTVKVTGTSVTGLLYWFTDDLDCVF